MGVAEAEEEAENAEEMFAALTFDKDVETVAGVKVSHLKMDLEKVAEMQEADEDELEEFKKFVGKEGVLVRVAAVGDKNVVLTFGGGEPQAAKVIEAAKGNEAPLSKNAGIMKVSEQLPKEQAGVMYVSLDRMLTRIKEFQTHMDEEPLPIEVPRLDAPIAMSGTGGDGWGQYDIFIPMELLVAGKNAAMTMMGQQAPPAGGEGM
jgi:hypothetical protein